MNINIKLESKELQTQKFERCKTLIASVPLLNDMLPDLVKAVTEMPLGDVETLMMMCALQAIKLYRVADIFLDLSLDDTIKKVTEYYDKIIKVLKDEDEAKKIFLLVAYFGYFVEQFIITKVPTKYININKGECQFTTGSSSNLHQLDQVTPQQLHLVQRPLTSPTPLVTPKKKRLNRPVNLKLRPQVDPVETLTSQQQAAAAAVVTPPLPPSSP